MLLPAIIFLSLQFGFSYRAERAAIEATTLERSRRIMSNVETNLERSKATASVLTTLRSIRQRNWEEANARLREVMALNPDWHSIRLWDLRSRQELASTDLPYGPPRPFDHKALNGLTWDKPVTVGGIDPGCLCIHVLAPVIEGGRTHYLIIVNLDAVEFQHLLMQQAPKNGVSAIVDRNGRFIARTLHYRERVGGWASRFLRAAIGHGTSGFYSGKTLEGWENYTAFATSPSTGWSVHIAVSSSAVDSPERLWRLATLVAALVSSLLAVGLIWLGLRTLTAQRKTDERLQQAQRLEAIGKLTGGIAHDFNNMLAIILGSLEIADRRLSGGNTDVQRYVNNAMDGARRAAELTRRMLAFSRRQTLEPVTIDVNALIEGMRDMLVRTLDANILIDCRFGADVWPVHADPGQLENAVLNLAVNARDAMPEGGVLTIITENVPETEATEDRVRIAVCDTGTGMTPAVKARAFEPFFSTKDIGKGTGLGLSQIYGFAQQSGGTAEIRSTVGEGTTVSILLPRSAEMKVRSPAPEHKAEIATGSADEVILVVEDDEDVRRTNVQALRELGYTVRETNDAVSALTMLGEEDGIRLLFTDVMMPGIGGRELAESARAAHSELKILFTTGYERDDSLGPEEGRMLRKPYSFVQLAKAIRDALDG